MKTRTFSLLTVLLLAGCAVGPNYRRPGMQAPAAFRAPEPLPPQQAASIADLKWFEVFNDAELQNLARTSLQRNYDLRDTVARVEESRALLGVTRSN
jgi:multidrug efflux system outer membrane protein